MNEVIKDKRLSEVLSALYRDQLHMEDFKKQVGEAVLESYKGKKYSRIAIRRAKLSYFF